MLLLDEVTVDMDVVGRLDLLAFFEEECAARGATILYATHIFDGLARWATHLALVEDGHLVRGVCPGGCRGMRTVSGTCADRIDLSSKHSAHELARLAGMLCTDRLWACMFTDTAAAVPASSRYSAFLFVMDAALSAHSCLPITVHVCAGGLSANS